jgi:hypothetical protein
MSTIPRSKHGDCVNCGKKNTSCVKHGKSLYCIDCRNNDKRINSLNKVSKKLTERSYLMEDDRASLVNDLDYVVSRYIRIRESDNKGNASCYTCGKIQHWTMLQAGHFIKRGETLLRWDSRNIKPQCSHCNCNLHGNIEVYESNLERELPSLPDELREQSKEVNKFTRDDLKEMLISYRAKLKMVEMRLK